MIRRILCLLILLVMISSPISTVFAADNEKAVAANKLFDLGLFNGVGTNADGTPDFDLDRTPSRNEAIVMLVRLMGKEKEALNGNWTIPFTDVADWAKPYVGYAYTNGLANGTSKTTFGGSDTVTASQFLTFVLRALGYDSGTDFRWNKAWELSDQLGLTNGEYSENVKSFTRGDLAIISFDALEIEQKGKSETLADKLILDGVFTSDEYKKAVSASAVLKMETDPSKLGISYTYMIDGEIYSIVKGFRPKSGTYTVTPLYNGIPFCNSDSAHRDYTVMVEDGNGRAVKNSDGTFTVTFSATDELVIALWMIEKRTEYDENGNPEVTTFRWKTNFSFSAPIPKKGFALDINGLTHFPEQTFGDNFCPYIVMRVYYNGSLIHDYEVSAGKGAPFTVSIQSDGSLLLNKIGKGKSNFTITYKGKSATFGYVSG